jgi:hypothetical protein
MKFIFAKWKRKVMMMPGDASIYEPKARIYDRSGRREVRVDTGYCSSWNGEDLVSDPELSPKEWAVKGKSSVCGTVVGGRGIHEGSIVVYAS